MDKKGLIHVITQEGTEVEMREPVISFKFKGISILCIFDVNADRMRFISAIAERSEISSAMLEQAMSANFHSALDARYCISNDIVYSAFIHPLGSLTHDFAASAISQVASAAATFGDEYTGGTYVFG